MDDGLKQRVIGALVLAAIAVIFLPSLFSGETGRRLDTRTQIPPAPEFKPVLESVPVHPEAVRSAPEPEQMYTLMDEADEAVSSQSTQDIESKSAPAADKSDGPERAQGAVAALDQQGIPLAWAVQVVSYRASNKAETLVARLKKDGYKAYVQRVRVADGVVFRVMVGPKLDRQEAQAVKQQLDNALKVESLLVKFKP